MEKKLIKNVSFIFIFYLVNRAISCFEFSADEFYRDEDYIYISVSIGTFLWATSKFVDSKKVWNPSQNSILFFDHFLAIFPAKFLSANLLKESENWKIIFFTLTGYILHVHAVGVCREAGLSVETETGDVPLAPHTGRPHPQVKTNKHRTTPPPPPHHFHNPLIKT